MAKQADHYRIPPQALESEQAVLGCILMCATTEAADTAREVLSAGDFFREAHRRIFIAAGNLRAADRPTDPLTVAEELERLGWYDHCGGRDYLLALMEVPPAASRLRHYAENVRDTSLKRQLMREAEEAIAAARNGTEPSEFAGLRRRMDRLLGALATPPGGAIQRQPFWLEELMAMEIPEPKWAVPELVPEGLTLLVGAPKIRKSWWALNVCIAVAAGGRALGKIPVDPGVALYLALEDPERRLQRRARQLTECGMVPPGRLAFHVEWPRWSDGGRGRLEAFLAKHPETRLVVLDTFARIRDTRDPKAAAYDDDYAAIVDIKRFADGHQLAVILIHHTRKGGADDFVETVSGTMGLTGAADSTLVLARKRGHSNAVLNVTGRDVEERELALEWDNHAGWVLMGGAEEYARTLADQQVLKAWAAAGRVPMNAEILAEQLECTQENARQRLSRMGRRGLMVPAGKAGWWRPTDAAAASLLLSGHTCHSVTEVTPSQCHTVTGDPFEEGQA